MVFEPDGGRYLTVENHQVELPDGTTIDDWLWLRTPDFINVLVQTSDGDYLVFRQTKYAVDGETLAVVGGYVEPGEDPAEAAGREIVEETGWRADEILPLGPYAVDGNRGAGVAHLFLATGARPLPPEEHVPSDDLEEQELLRMNEDQLRTALFEGQFKVVSWAATVALGLLADNPLSKPLK